ncbi:hypothetical protein NADFUDRAFT_72074 [Nadsonia fulvescens var. elongata DSM 6958]|uniref:Sortilin C-terminal domain-containing protein n=1 Tax=Nadsonia fulvescens var. elongata DSM 6958 TaxID=857566 RepID=A0A1E3PDD2_9ASCO|nr:hypothetical protein NADFUDRAFT_72074 [Nadsonia fulvescens var. elongata DSM 6958]
MFGRLPLTRGKKAVTIQIYFSRLIGKQCSIPHSYFRSQDFEHWSPKHPFQDKNCLFSHEVIYNRKIPEKDCYMGNLDLSVFKYAHNFACTRQDYECDFNYFRAGDGSCQLVNGLSPSDNSLICSEKPGTIEYWVSIGYRGVPLST